MANSGELCSSLPRAASSLTEELAGTLPIDASFTFYHISTPPTKCPAIFSAHANLPPHQTYCESHFLAVAVKFSSTSSDNDRILVFAVEVLIYTTAYLTTLFVSKADSTGYLHLLNLDCTHVSPLRSICTTFISFLVRERQRPGIKTVISLFARAQDQYLFPGSVENSRKHVLDDRGLVKWWGRVLDPVLRRYPSPSLASGEANRNRDGAHTGSTAEGYVIAPGLDKYETAALLPVTVKTDPAEARRWINDHPLREISSQPNAPPRCLIPHFPDDPKARFLDELDEEVVDASHAGSSDSPLKRGNEVQWKTIKTLEQFWDAMAFRQECSSGRMVGFIWVVISADAALEGSSLVGSKAVPRLSSGSVAKAFAGGLPTPESSQDVRQTLVERGSRRKRRKLTGPIHARQPRVKVVTTRSSITTVPSQTKYYIWPTTSRGQVVLDQKDYKRVCDLLLRLEFANQEAARASTQRWVDDVGAIAVVRSTRGHWGEVVKGTKSAETARISSSAGINTLGESMIKKLPKGEDRTSSYAGQPDSAGPRVLAAGLVRKKPKT
ncbi:MAG: hypothetical protein M1817_000536 [Caeruleum heppii]|nr:MAG: hypothetical protein M1817_000536 [Caeruleum heppii]